MLTARAASRDPRERASAGRCVEARRHIESEVVVPRLHVRLVQRRREARVARARASIVSQSRLPKLHLRVDEPRDRSAASTSPHGCHSRHSDRSAASRSRRNASAASARARAAGTSAATNFVMKPSDEVQAGGDARALRRAAARRRPSAESDTRRRSSTGTAALPCCWSAGRARRAAARGRTAAAPRRRRRPARPAGCRSRTRRGTATPPNSASQKRRPNSSCGSSPALIGAATIQNFSGGFSRKTAVSLRTALGLQPVADLEDAIDGERVDGFVGLEIEAAEADEERQAEEDEDESQPGPAHAQSLMQVTSDQIRGTFTFSIDTGLSSACARNAGQIEIRLEADVDRERRDQPLDPRPAADSRCGSD